MKKNAIPAIKIALFGLGLVTVGLATWLTTSFILNNNSDNAADEVIDKNNKEIVFLEKSADVPVKLVEHETNGSFFFGVAGLKILNERIKTDLQFGPEIEDLKTITINNLSKLESNVNGQYNPFTQEISISISNLIPNFQNIPSDEKVELIFQTIFHEYAHHFANVYITSIATNDVRNSKKLFTLSRDRSVHKNISKKFLEAFEKSLHYSDNETNNLLSQNRNQISNLTTARKLYEASNSANIKNSSSNNDYLNIGNDFYTDIPSKKSTRRFPINSDKYTYLFSIDELLARKWQQISYVDILNGRTIANKTTSFTGTENNNTFSPTTIAWDISKNRNIEFVGKDEYKINDGLILMDYPYGGTFIDNTGKTNIIESTVNDLWNAYLNISGYQHGISQIYLNNSSKQVSRTTRSSLRKDDFTSIKFSGYLDNSKSYKSLLFKNKNESSYFRHNFVKNNYEYNFLSAKSDVLSRERDLVKPKNKFGYVTDYINISKIDLNAPIKVWNDKNNNNKVEVGESESLSVSPDRPTSTFRESFVRTFENGETYMDADIVNNNFYEVVNNKNDAYLKLYKTDNSVVYNLSINQNQRFPNYDIPIFQDQIMFDDRQNKKK